ncbi:MAG: hypothetical protein APR63_05790 [Desulfuromonas sp. SDB]|nr:MAG: hypothetical protein APR63_05790 [Desulfuromonas sp. SDB]
MKDNPDRYYIGTSGWNYTHWKNVFYPQEISNKEWFDFYSEKFKTVEINYSFYRWPDKKTVMKWKNQAPGNFKFTLKAFRGITHYKKLKEVHQDIIKLYKLGNLLDKNLGCFLFQLPPSYTCTSNNINKLADFIDILDSRRKNVIEFRDGKWWNSKIFQMLERKKIAFCNVSGLNMPKQIFPTADFYYHRLHGEHYSTKYSPQEINKLAQQIKKLSAKYYYIYFNNDKSAYAVENARQLRNEIENA